MKNLTDDQKKDVETRLNAFQDALEKLQQEHQIELQAFPVYVPTPNGATTIAQIGLRDTKYAPIKSPFSPAPEGPIIQEG